MDFFRRQDLSRRNTRRLVVYFSLGIVLLVFAVYLAILLMFSLEAPGRSGGSAWWHPQIFLWSSLGTISVVGIGTLSKISQLSRGGSAVAEMVGGQLVSPGTSDPLKRRLLNIVEEMSIAAGMPVPQVYVLAGQDGINAFAAGFSTSDAAVGVTRGALDRLDRDELQGVIAHEFSHILNGDMRLNIRLISLVFGIACLAVIGRILLETRSRSRRGKNPLPALGLALLMIGWIGSFFGRLIQSAVSREREFLADASAVQFTRNPAGLAGALKKIGGLSLGSTVDSAHASEVAHLFFGSSTNNAGWLDTHPPLEERIRALDPSFDGVFPVVAAADVQGADVSFRSGSRPRSPLRVGLPAGVSRLSAPPLLRPVRVMEQIGTLQPGQVRYVESMRENAPSELLEGARQPMIASCIVYALLISKNTETQTLQLKELEVATSPQVVDEMLRVLHLVQDVAVRARLPLVDLVIPTLKLLSPAQFAQFSNALERLVTCDEQVDLFEFTLSKVVARNVAPAFTGADRKIVQYYSIGPLVSDCAVLLSALAHCGPSDPNCVRSAFYRGANLLAQYSQTEIPFPSTPEERGLQQISDAIDRLSQAAPQIKKNVILACAHTVAADGLVHEHEAELLRAISDTLDCPLPPFLPGE